MALFMKQNEERSQLQERLAAELQERAKKNKQLKDLADGVEDSRYLEGTKRTTTLAWVWILIVIAAIIAAVGLILIKTSKY